MENKTEVAKKEIEKVLDTYGLKIGYELTFPVYRILPDEVVLALKVIEKHQMKITQILLEKKNPPQK